jgi:hypothetical protein
LEREGEAPSLPVVMNSFSLSFAEEGIGKVIEGDEGIFRIFAPPPHPKTPTMKED